MVIEEIISDLDEDELRTIYSFLTNFFLGLLEPVKPKDLVKYVKTNSVFDMRPYLKLIPEGLRMKLRGLVKNNKHLLEKYVNGEKLIELAGKKRKDLYEILKTPKGTRWANAFMRYIRQVVYLI